MWVVWSDNNILDFYYLIEIIFMMDVNRFFFQIPPKIQIFQYPTVIGIEVNAPVSQQMTLLLLNVTKDITLIYCLEKCNYKK